MAVACKPEQQEEIEAQKEEEPKHQDPIVGKDLSEEVGLVHAGHKAEDKEGNEAGEDTGVNPLGPLFGSVKPSF